VRKGFDGNRNIILHSYTLVEMLVVIAIIAILIGIGAGGYTVARKWMAKSSTEALLSKLKIALESYKNDKGYYPQPNVDATVSTEDAPNFRLDTNSKDYSSGTHPEEELQPRNNMNNFIDYSKIQQDQSLKIPGNPNIYFVKDGWNTPAGNETFGAIKYRCPGLINKTTFDLYSAGPDRRFASHPDIDTEDDIYCKL
jgi:prepilin-type N-terminal cleavage/methylation domain-containing protein